jgi:hypothetical protein
MNFKGLLYVISVIVLMVIPLVTRDIATVVVAMVILFSTSCFIKFGLTEKQRREIFFTRRKN